METGETREIRIRLFASLRELTGESQLSWAISEGETVSQLFDRLVVRYPRISPLKNSIRYAVNESYVDPDQSLHPGDEIAFIPPVAGG